MAQDIMAGQPAGQVETNSSDGSITAPASSSTQPSLASDSVVDAVSSLRALALSTMRSKRRKEPSASQVIPGKPLSGRPATVPSEVDLLDYGSEEVQKTQDVPEALTGSNVGTSVNEGSKQNSRDVELREEGEISDEDIQDSPGPPTDTPVNSARTFSEFVSQKSGSPLPTSAISTLAPTASSQPSPQSAFREQGLSTARDQWNNWVPDEDHVRPGLKMSMDQFNLVKELVLDLLGWGVSPEYLVDCGLTREAIFYTFTELNLRLPRNLDVSGLSPFPPPELTVVNNTQQSQIVPTRRQSISHPLPVKPAGYTVVPPVVSANADVIKNNINSHNLSDMEAQRRQELQARKAVLATRKKKITIVTSEQGAASSPTTHSAVANTSVNLGAFVSVAPTEAVDDFLNSMLEDTAPLPVSAPPSRLRALSGGVALGILPVLDSPVSTDAMDVDADDIPGLGSHRRQHYPDSMHTLQARSPSPQNIASAGASSSIMETGLDGVNVSLRSTPTPTPTVSADIDRVMIQIPSAQTVHNKRGTKRPVAMDFVDLDQNVPTITRSTMYPPAVHPPYMRRKMESFAGLGANKSRRCVIDVSDSEEEEPGGRGHDEEGVASVSSSSNQDGLRVNFSTSSSRPESSRPPSRISNTPAKPASPNLPTPETLMEKEKEIKRMRELIARRELLRLRKLAEVQKTRTPAGSPPPSSGSIAVREEALSTSTESVIAVKVEDADGAPELASAVSDSVGRVAHPWTESESSCEQEDVDAVMQDLTEPGLMSDSSSSTPIDIKKSVIEHCDTGERVLTTEAKEEQRPSTMQDQMILEENITATPVDVNLHTSSARDIDARPPGVSIFTDYSSPFHSYPLLRSRSRVVADLASEVHSPSCVSFSSLSSILPSADERVNTTQKTAIPDLRPLRVAVILREVGSDLDRRICQYEVPGGGMCRDKTCADVHLGDLEPDDHETARYLIETMPDILQTYDESEVVDQLLQARQKKATIGKISAQGTETPSTSCSLEATVAEAIAALVGVGR
ncbi:hypothetical protein M0805_005148 [Coniferiporia weirii]|nr:hypothetical protein M0805_005148 [Coniferiporia weirii]